MTLRDTQAKRRIRGLAQQGTAICFAILGSPPIPRDCENVRMFDHANCALGRQPVPWQPRVRCLAVDTNVLRSEVVRRVRRPNEQRSRMLTAAMTGGLRVLAAPHVVHEMDEHVQAFARRAHVDPTAAVSAWFTEYRPSMRVVDVSDVISELAHHPYVGATLARDPDDAPTAALAVLLGQPALSEDGDLGLAATGRAWLEHVIAATDAVLSDSTSALVAWGAAETLGGAIRGARNGYRWLQGAVGPTAAAIMALVLASAVVGSLFDPRSRRVLWGSPPARTAARATFGLLEGVGVLAARGESGQAFIDAARFSDALCVPVTAILIRLLAASPTPLTLVQIANCTGLGGSLVARLLDAHAAFVPVGDGWELGRRLPRPRQARALGPPRIQVAARAWPALRPGSLPAATVTTQLLRPRWPSVRFAQQVSPPSAARLAALPAPPILWGSVVET